MKTILYLAFSVFAWKALAYDFNIGEEILNQELIWRRLPNGDGSSCQLQYLAKLTVKTISSEAIIVQYESDRVDFPANCLNGILLSFEPHYLDTIRDNYFVYKEKKSALAKIKRGESSRSYNGYSVGEELGVNNWSWVIVDENIDQFREGDLCRVTYPMSVAILGFYEEKNLILFSYPRSGNGYKECPENTLFFDKI